MALTPERDALGVWLSVAVPLRIVAACVDAAGRNDVHSDVVRGEFGGETTGQPDQAHLRRRQMGAAGAAGADRTVATEKQEPAVLILHHRLDQRARQVDRPVEDDAANMLPLLLRPEIKGFCGRIAALLIRMSTR